jgi:hypothetical protein
MKPPGVKMIISWWFFMYFCAEIDTLFNLVGLSLEGVCQTDYNRLAENG